MMSTKEPTLQDVARLAEVSTATVSRCINQPEMVRESVREKIQLAINTLDYVPHAAARALASRRTQTIGAVVPTIDNAIFSDAIEYLQRELRQSDYTLLIASNGFSLTEELKAVQTLLTRGIDGLVLVGETHLDEVHEAIERKQIPHVNLWIYNSDSKYNCIGLDHIKAGARIASHLVTLGHRRYGFVSGILADNDRAEQRLAGAQQYLHDAGMPLTPSHIAECLYSVSHARQATHKLLDRYPEITAIMCGNDVLAVGALWAARERGLIVPTQLSITGFDNVELAQAVTPALTTINAPSRRIGRSAGQFIIEAIKDKPTREAEPIHRTELQADLIIRESTDVAPL